MINLAKLLISKYILYELCHHVRLGNVPLDENVLHVFDIELLKNNSFGINLAEMERLLKNNVGLFVYSEEGSPLGMMCGHYGSCYIRGPGIALSQDNDTVYWFWGLTLPRARGKNVFKKLKNVFFAHYHKAKKITALIDSGNSLMRREMSKMGFIPCKQYFSVKYGNSALVFEKCIKTKQIHVKIEHDHDNSRDTLII